MKMSLTYVNRDILAAFLSFFAIIRIKSETNACHRAFEIVTYFIVLKTISKKKIF